VLAHDPEKACPGLIRDGRRFSEKIMRHEKPRAGRLRRPTPNRVAEFKRTTEKSDVDP